MYRAALSALLLFLLTAGAAKAHFGMVIPSRSMVTDPGQAQLGLELSFSHPFEKIGMPLEKPREFSVWRGGEATSLLATLRPAEILGDAGWRADYRIRRPGLYQFVMEPPPYWEPAEDAYIKHLTKTVVASFGEESGWEEPLGLRAEILPLTRPFGLYGGNLFRGRVLFEGEPVPFAEVEIEPFVEGDATPANGYMVTQRVRADAQGSFSYVAPASGWWGFAAILEAPEKILREGQEKPLELGAVLWVKFEPFPGHGGR